VKICHSPLDIDYVELILAKQKGSSFTNLATHGLHILAVTLTDRDRFRAIALFGGFLQDLVVFARMHPNSSNQQKR